MMNRSVLFLGVIVIAACATPYQEMGYLGGYEETQLGPPPSATRAWMKVLPISPIACAYGATRDSRYTTASAPKLPMPKADNASPAT